MTSLPIIIRLVAFAVTALAPFASHAASPWTVSESTSPTTGITTTTLQNASAGEGSFVVYCTSNGSWGYYLSTAYPTANGAVRYRIGPSPVQVESWAESPATGSQALFPPTGSLSLLREIYDNWDVVFQYNALQYGSRTMAINASGFSAVIDQTRAACNWPTDLLPPDNGWGKELPAAPPTNAREAAYVGNAPNQFRLIAWRGHNVEGKPQLLVRLGDRFGPCTGPLPITDQRLYVMQGGKTVSAVSGRNFEVDCLTSPIIVALNGDFDAGMPFTLSTYSYSGSAINLGAPIAILTFDDPLPTLFTLIEYYNAAFDHYFITWLPAEIALLDAGTLRGWVRTGQSFATYIVAANGTSAVCRYYIPPRLGDSHFYGRGMDECSATGANHPDFILEDASFMQMYMPSGGVCPAYTTEVYRVFNNRADANHRYTTDKAVRDAMVARGWRAEGDGPNLVVMCAPQ